MRSQQVKFVKVIRKAGLDPTEFQFYEIDEEDGDKHSKLVHGPSRFYVESLGNGFRISPGESTAVDFVSDVDDLPTFLNIVTNWLRYSKRELQAPSWKELCEMDFLDQEAPDESFTPLEQSRLEVTLRQFERKVLTELQPTRAEAEDIHHKLDVLVEASKTSSRREWGLFALGTLANIAATLDPEKARILWALARAAGQSFKHLLLT